jgi:acyl carrier protein
MASELTVKIVEILNNHLELKHLDATNIDDEQLVKLGVNSLTFIKIAFAIETEFGFRFQNEELDFIKYPSFKSFIDFIETKINTAKGDLEC